MEMAALAELCRMNNDDSNTVRLEQAVCLCEESEYGQDDEITLAGHNRVGNSLANLGKREEALYHLVRAFMKRKTLLGEDHPSTLNSMNGVGAVLLKCATKLGETRSEQGLMILQDCHERSEKVLGPRHERTVSVRCNVGLALYICSRRREAKTLLEGLLIDLEQLQHTAPAPSTALVDAKTNPVAISDSTSDRLNRVALQVHSALGCLALDAEEYCRSAAHAFQAWTLSCKVHGADDNKSLQLEIMLCTICWTALTQVTFTSFSKSSSPPPPLLRGGSTSTSIAST
jgi:hypothetical protein